VNLACWNYEVKTGEQSFVYSRAIYVAYTLPLLLAVIAKTQLPCWNGDVENQLIGERQKSHFLLRSNPLVVNNARTTICVNIGNREMQFEWFAHIYFTVWGHVKTW
jgi:hypothetical protein